MVKNVFYLIRVDLMLKLFSFDQQSKTPNIILLSYEKKANVYILETWTRHCLPFLLCKWLKLIINKKNLKQLDYTGQQMF